MDLVYKNEKPLFVIAALISGLFWLALVLGTLGIFLIYVLLAYVIFLFAHSAFISHLKGSGVKITPEQYPDLHAKLVKSCERVGLKEVPDAYLLRTDFFNALATRFLGRSFVVLFTDVVDALEDHPDAIDFYIGHELGHIHRNHLLWKPLLMPASILPLLGPALRRAEEYTCDRYGTACCESEDDVKAALAAIAAGDSRWKTINVSAYLEQTRITSGFWMSFHELTGDYPWLTKRMATALALHRGEKVSHPSRHGLAWLLALFIPRTGVGGGIASIFVVIAIIGILAAIAIPAYKDYQQRAAMTSGYGAYSDMDMAGAEADTTDSSIRLRAAYFEAYPLQQEVTDYAIENQEWPASLENLGYPDVTIANHELSYDIDLYDGGMIGVWMGNDVYGEGEYLVMEPQVDEQGQISWLCYGQNVDTGALPAECR
ncbi:M48 family metallopeptidase [Marinobacter sp. LN3S78]|uniref:M48 family metallopeptidase n=1 Tax=Marinobacter sp. LN3S78 TaxID=3382300 RepID=UPI00387ABACF